MSLTRVSIDFLRLHCLQIGLQKPTETSPATLILICI